MYIRAAFAVAAYAASAFAAQAATKLIDFTDRNVWSGQYTGATSQATYGNLTVTLSTRAKERANFNQDFDGNKQGDDQSYCQAFSGPLACISDGLGIGDDEVTAIDLTVTPPIQSATLTFNRKVRIVGLHFLDLFTDKPQESGDVTREQANVYVDGAYVPGDTSTFTTFQAMNSFQENGGYAFYATNILAHQTATFFASAFPNNDGVGRPDFALAGVAVSPIPLPASALLFMGALAGLGLLRRKGGAQI